MLREQSEKRNIPVREMEGKITDLRYFISELNQLHSQFAEFCKENGLDMDKIEPPEVVMISPGPFGTVNMHITAIAPGFSFEAPDDGVTPIEERLARGEKPISAQLFIEIQPDLKQLEELVAGTIQQAKDEQRDKSKDQ